MQPDDLRRSATEYVRGEEARGFLTCGMIVSGVAEYLDGAAEPADLYGLAWEIVPREFAAHFEAQAGWPARTDSDRLTDAFRALDLAGIVAREDFAEKVKKYYERWDKSLPEDNAISEVQQIGVNSSFHRPGRLSDQERAVHYMANWILDRVLD